MSASMDAVTRLNRNTHSTKPVPDFVDCYLNLRIIGFEPTFPSSMLGGLDPVGLSIDVDPLIGITGLEPVAPPSQTVCSTKLSYIPWIDTKFLFTTS